MNQKTLCFLLRQTDPPEVLLGLKKVGFGAGKYAGFGGGVEAGETIAAATVRELLEEAGVSVAQRDLIPAGQLTFLFSARPQWNQAVHVFLARLWQGVPTASVEMQPEWWRADALPLAQMWADAAHWLPLVLQGQTLQARFVYEADNATLAEVSVVANLAAP